MRRTLLLLSLITLACALAGATKHTITAPGLAFSPINITITEGDTVVFSISGIHNAVEVSQTTWNADGTTPLGGGFAVGFGGGEAIPSGVGTHWYVCQAHVGGSSMKGTITVDPATPAFGGVLISSIVDRDGILGTTSDQVGKNWSLKLYQDSVGSGIVVDSAASAWSLFVDSLLPGTYVAVEADSAHWTHISQVVDAVSQGPTGANFRSIVVGEGENHTIDFLNYAPNVVISFGFTFQPDTIMVDSSDTVRFVLDPMHNAREVDSLTWSADDTVSNGGFETPFGGGDVVMSSPGTHWYVCAPHGTGGMKGVVMVSPAGALSVPVEGAWNLLSLPFLPDDNTVTTLYPTATSAAFTYQTGYNSQTSVSPGQGYWLKFAVAQSVDLDGVVLLAETVAVTNGWNIIGGLSVPVPTGSITTIGTVIASSFYGYGPGGYFTATQLEPGYGYWVKVNGDGFLVLEAPPAAAPATERMPGLLEGLPHRNH